MADKDTPPPFQFLPRSMEGDFEKRKKLRETYQNSFTEVVSMVFAPKTQAIIFNSCKARDTQIKAEAETEIKKNLGVAPPGRAYIVRLRTYFEVQSILYEQYRDGYFTIMNFVGVNIFDLIGDPNRQEFGLIEAEDARLDNMLERIRHAAAEMAVVPH